MPFYEIEFDYTGSAPTTSQTYNFCIDELGFEAENVRRVGPIRVEIDGSSKDYILGIINDQLPQTRSNTEYLSAS
jgi:hypothetical protein